MSGICSRHWNYDPDCRMCNTDVRELLPDYDEKVREAEEAGKVDCGACGFTFYRTTKTCPLCSRWTWLDDGHEIYWPFHGANDPRRGHPDWIGYFEYEHEGSTRVVSSRD